MPSLQYGDMIDCPKRFATCVNVRYVDKLIMRIDHMTLIEELHVGLNVGTS